MISGELWVLSLCSWVLSFFCACLLSLWGARVVLRVEEAIQYGLINTTLLRIIITIIIKIKIIIIIIIKIIIIIIKTIIITVVNNTGNKGGDLGLKNHGSRFGLRGLRLTLWGSMA